MTISIERSQQKTKSIWKPFQRWIGNIEIKEEQTARRIIKLIPAQCPFEREIKFLGKVIFRIPAMCKLNPCYDQLIELRFRALCFLADTCGEDITPYCT